MVIVTGATGVIGRAVVNALKSRGATLLTIGRSPECDLQLDLAANQAPLTKILKRQPETIIHCAAAVPGGSQHADNEANANQTRAIDRAIFSAASSWQCNVVYISGCSLYQRSSREYLDESSLFAEEFKSPYLMAKRDGDLLFSSYSRATIARVSTPIGPGLSKYSVLGRFIESAKKNGTIEVWGDGAREQDYVNVRDIAGFIVSCLNSTTFGPVNVAAGSPVTMLELATLISSCYQSCEVVVTPIADPNAEQMCRYNTERARLFYNWAPCVSIQDSISEVIGKCW